ncbi:MAG: amino acid ABC transporter substrate-binding protein [Gammaproteobacteria bacterium]|nr:amino acid ABC transporter substrate-binding protein [Gammaproteobacteria bacterium]
MRLSRKTIHIVLLAMVQFLLVPITGKAADLAEIRDRGTLIVGMDPPYGIMEFYDTDKNLTGIDVDLSRAIGKSLNVSVKFKTMPFAHLFDAVDSGKIDIIVSAVSITQERQQTILFSAPYLDASLSAIAREDNDAIVTIDDAKNGKVGVLKGTVGEKFARESPVFEQATVVSFMNNDDRMKSLMDGSIDLALAHFLTPGAYPVKTLSEPLQRAYYGVATKLGNMALMNHIDRILRDMKREGTLRIIQAKYLK